MPHRSREARTLLGVVDYRENFLVKAGRRLKLSSVDPSFHGHHEDAQSAALETEQYRQKLANLQSVLYAEHKRSVLVVLQALDAGGKDGTVRHVFSALNPQGSGSTTRRATGRSASRTMLNGSCGTNICRRTRMRWRRPVRGMRPGT
jgi:hypothetical protein